MHKDYDCFKNIFCLRTFEVDSVYSEVVSVHTSLKACRYIMRFYVQYEY